MIQKHWLRFSTYARYGCLGSAVPTSIFSLLPCAGNQWNQGDAASLHEVVVARIEIDFEWY